MKELNITSKEDILPKQYRETDSPKNVVNDCCDISHNEKLQDVQSLISSDVFTKIYEKYGLLDGCTLEKGELTDEGKQYLKDKLDWTENQIAKCTIGENGIIDYRTDRYDLEGSALKNGVQYARKTITINSVTIEGVFPVFDSAFDVQLPKNLEKASNAKQFKECNVQLKEAVQNDDILSKKFTGDQLDDIANTKTPEGYVWHHNEEEGKMQLVKIEDHDRTQGGAAHTGGKALWGGGYNHSVLDENVGKRDLSQLSDKQEV